MEPTNMPDQHTNPNADVPGGLHGQHHTAANEQLPRSIWQPGVVQRLADYVKHVREVDQQSDKPHVTSQPDQSHVCERNPNRVCDCARGVCADDDATYRLARNPRPRCYTGNPDLDAKYACPVSGVACFGIKCREWCESGVDYSKT